MVDVDKAVIARLKKGGKQFEIKVDCDKALEFKEGKNVSFEDILATNEIYFDVKKGEKASTGDFQDIFQTEDVILELNRILKIWRFENYQTRKNCRLKDYERFGRWATSPERDADGLDYIFYDGPDNIIAFWDSKTRVLFAK